VTRRSYDQYCALARALDVVGERWTLLIVRNLLLGPRRYTDLQAELPGITTNLLAKRLAEMEEAGLVERQLRPPPTPAAVYALTTEGAALEPVIHALGGWGGRFMGKPRRSDTLNLGWAMIALKRRYRGGLCGSVRFVVRVGRGGERRYTLRFDGPSMTVRDSEDSGDVDAVVTADVGPARAVLMGGDEAARAELAIEGDAAFVDSVLDALAPDVRASGSGRPRV